MGTVVGVGVAIAVVGAAACGARTELVDEGFVPRPIAPLSTSIVSSHQPILRWQTPRGTTSTEVEICRDPACADRVAAFETVEDHATTPIALSPGAYFWRLRARARGLLWPTPSPVWELRVTTRDAPISTSWGTVLDVNLDGHPDLAASANDIPSASGLVAVYHGVEGGLAATPAVVLRGADDGGLYYALNLANAGDVNGDGFSDLVVSGELSDQNGPIEVYFGSPDGLPPKPSQLVGPVIPNAMAAVGDVNGDGYADVVIGALSEAYICLGSSEGLQPPSGPLHGPGGAFHPGDALLKAASAGDVDGDGFGDVIIGYPQANAQGLAFVYEGGRDGLSGVPATILGAGIAVDEPFSGMVGDVGDVNGDGFADVGVGVILPGPGPNRALVYAGSASGVSAQPYGDFTPAAGVGVEPKSAGDLDRDGFDEALFRSSGLGAAGLDIAWGGGAGFARGDTAISLQPTGTEFWDTGSVVGDVDGDGVPDYAAGVASRAIAIHRGGSDGIAPAPALELALPTPTPRYGPHIAAAIY